MSQNESHPTQNLAPSEIAAKLPVSGHPHYDNQVFPKIAQREKVFNWFAALFGYFWFPYKGLWGTWAKIYLPFAAFSTLFMHLKWTIPLMMGTIALFLFMGFRGNEEYFKFVQNKGPAKANAWAGFGGWLGYAICCSLFLAIWGGFFPQARVGLAHTGPSQVKQEQLPPKRLLTPEENQGRQPASSEPSKDSKE